MGYQRQIWWTEKPVAHIVRKSDNAGAGNWGSNWRSTDIGTYDIAQIEVYSNCDDVELFLIDKSLGSKTKPADDSPRSWEITFEEETLKAVTKNNGKIVATDVLKTANSPAKIILTADKTQLSGNWDDVSYITAKVVDENGIVCPFVDKLISFNISENGKIVTVDNGAM